MDAPTPPASRPTSMRKTLIAIIVIAMLLLAVTIEIRRRQAQQELERLTVRLEQLETGNTQQNSEAAERIVNRVRQLIVIPDDVEPTVATIVDVEMLRNRNSFYDKAENGDHLIVTTDRAILYDPDEDVILDVVPVQLQPAEPTREQ